MKSLNHNIIFLFLIFSSLVCNCQEQLYIDSGQASYYAPWLQGYRTANGEHMNNNNYTAAHQFLPFNTVLKIINPENDSIVYVRINDRGPYRKKRLLDLSGKAAIKLDMIHNGVIKIKVQNVPVTSDTPVTLKEYIPDTTISTNNRNSANNLYHIQSDTFYYIVTVIDPDDHEQFDHLLDFLNSINENKFFSISQPDIEENYYVVYTGIYKNRLEVISEIDKLNTTFILPAYIKIYIH